MAALFTVITAAIAAIITALPAVTTATMAAVMAAVIAASPAVTTAAIAAIMAALPAIVTAVGAAIAAGIAKCKVIFEKVSRIFTPGPTARSDCPDNCWTDTRNQHREELSYQENARRRTKLSGRSGLPN